MCEIPRKSTRGQGIVASSIVETCKKPTVLISLLGGNSYNSGNSSGNSTRDETEIVSSYDNIAVPCGFELCSPGCEIVTVATVCGYKLSCTHNQMVLTTEGWKHAGDLIAGKDLVALGVGGPIENVELDPSWQIRGLPADIVDIVRDSLGSTAAERGKMTPPISRILFPNLRDSIEFIRLLWIYAGRPDGRLVLYSDLHRSIVPNIVRSMLLRCGVVCHTALDAENDEMNIVPVSNGDSIIFDAIIRFSDVDTVMRLVAGARSAVCASVVSNCSERSTRYATRRCDVVESVTTVAGHAQKVVSLNMPPQNKCKCDDAKDGICALLSINGFVLPVTCSDN